MDEPTCSINDCPKPARSRGWCGAHYARWRKHGDPLGGGRARNTGDASNRFWANVREFGTCWVWCGFLKENGYGSFYAQGRKHYAHRWAYEEMVSQIPEGLTIDHLCRNRACVNPYHMDPVPQGINAARGVLSRAIVIRCPAGHEYTEENTIARGGKRWCRTCEHLRGLARAKNPGIGRGGSQRAKSHCPQGHPYDQENTYYTKNGGRVCRTCFRASVARYKAKKRPVAA